jgi:3-oxoacyl-[acyl-carrier-protein] synthase II
MRRTRKQFIELMPSTPLTTMMREHDFHGPCMGVMAMCASGNAGLLTARQWIEGGMATDVVVVATDISARPENIKPFVDLGVAVADRSPLDGCRPFQEGSSGFIVGEASVAMVLSRSGDAYARVRGGAMTQDAHHVISIEPTYGELRRCWTTAMANAGVEPGAIVYLNAHGPGTRQCDTAEARLFDELLPDATGLYSFKPLAGHCQGAAAAVEVALTCLSYDSGWIPAPPQVAPGHPRLVSGLSRRRRGPVAKSSIGMGGNNSMVVLDEPA